MAEENQKPYTIVGTTKKALEYQRYKLKKNNRCVDCNFLIKPLSIRCHICKMKKRWVDGTMPKMKPNNGTFKKGFVPWHKGKSVPHLGGANHWNWKGGVTSVNEKIRKSLEYEDWRKKVFERDNYTCQNCRQIGGYLQADHIKPFSLYPELRFELTNGRTLCLECHKLIGWKGSHINGGKRANL